jgi:hypothetical protein
MSSAPDYKLHRDAFGRLVFTHASGEICEGVVLVRAFPISAPDGGFALVDTYGHELAWIEKLSDLPEDYQSLLSAELAGREFMPVISRLLSVSSYATPCQWTVQTNHGDTQFILKGEEDIRRLTPPSLLIADSHGIHYLIRDRNALDAHSRKILDRFL